MRLSSIATAIYMASAASAIRVSYDRGYDDRDRKLSAVACSDGEYGLQDKYPTQGSIPNFPNIGGSFTVDRWSSPKCGTCYSLKYKDQEIFITAIDSAKTGFNIGEVAMNKLTGGRAEQVGHIDVEYKEVDRRQCRL